MMNNYIHAAKQLKNIERPIPLGNFESFSETDILSEYNITDFPTLILFNERKPIKYNEIDFLPNSIINWVKKISFPRSLKINEEKELNEIKDQYDVVVFFIGLNNKDFEIFEEISEEFSEPIFIHTFNKIEKYIGKENKSNVIIFKKFDEGNNFITNFFLN